MPWDLHAHSREASGTFLSSPRPNPLSGTGVFANAQYTPSNKFISAGSRIFWVEKVRCRGRP